MLGWHVSVYRLGDEGRLSGIADVPALLESLTSNEERHALRDSLVKGEKMAVWQTGVFGLDWLSALEAEQRAIELPGDGYPDTFLLLARDLTPHILSGERKPHRVWHSRAADAMQPKWDGRKVVSVPAVGVCSPGEWLIVEAWD